MKNTYRNTNKKSRKSADPKSREPGVFWRVLQGEFLEKNLILKHLPFVFFLAFLGILYISASYYAVNRVQDIDRLEERLKNLKAESIDLENQLMEQSKKFNLKERLISRGLEIPKTPPRVLDLSPDSLEMMY